MEQRTELLNRAEVGLYQYQLVAHPDTGVNQKVMAEKEIFTSKYQQKISVKTSPHIAVANFVAREAMEETIVRYTQRICSQQNTFELALNNYSGFPPHTVYLRVQNPQPLKQFGKELKVVSNYLRSCSCPPVKLITNPHLIITTGLPESIYLKAMMDYSQKCFHETFKVDEFVLLRRSNEYDSCKTVHVFRLQLLERSF